MSDLILVVGILSQSTLLLCLTLICNYFSYLWNWWWLEISASGISSISLFSNVKIFIIDVITQSCRNAIKVQIEWAGNYFGFINNDAI